MTGPQDLTEAERQADAEFAAARDVYGPEWPWWLSGNIIEAPEPELDI
jgi:hypothetical protein